jgi:hypothetical protein
MLSDAKQMSPLEMSSRLGVTSPSTSVRIIPIQHRNIVRQIHLFCQHKNHFTGIRLTMFLFDSVVKPLIWLPTSAVLEDILWAVGFAECNSNRKFKTAKESASVTGISVDNSPMSITAGILELFILPISDTASATHETLPTCRGRP